MNLFFRRLLQTLLALSLPISVASASMVQETPEINLTHGDAQPQPKPQMLPRKSLFQGLRIADNEYLKLDRQGGSTEYKEAPAGGSIGNQNLKLDSVGGSTEYKEAPAGGSIGNQNLKLDSVGGSTGYKEAGLGGTNNSAVDPDIKNNSGITGYKIMQTGGSQLQGNDTLEGGPNPSNLGGEKPPGYRKNPGHGDTPQIKLDSLGGNLKLDSQGGNNIKLDAPGGNNKFNVPNHTVKVKPQ